MLGKSKSISFAIERKYIIETTVNEVFDGNGKLLRGLYEAYDAQLGRKVAVKLAQIAGQNAREKDAALKKAYSEVKAMVFLTDKILFIPRIYETYYDEKSSCLYIVMEWISGETLEHLMERNQMDELQFIGFMKKLCGILKVMERNDKYYHKDIKPANIMIRDRDLFLIDFNITISAVSRDEGTQAYMSPEVKQLIKELRREKADMFSIGVMMYEYYAKKRPVYGRDYGGLSRLSNMKEWKVFTEPKQVVETVPEEINAIICRCMKLKIDDRFRDYSDLERQLMQYERTLRNKGRSSYKKGGKSRNGRND